MAAWRGGLEKRVAGVVRGALEEALLEALRGGQRGRLGELLRLVRRPGFEAIIPVHGAPGLYIDVLGRAAFLVGSRDPGWAVEALAGRGGLTGIGYLVVVGRGSWALYRVAGGSPELLGSRSGVWIRGWLRGVFYGALRGGWGLVSSPETVAAVFGDVADEGLRLLDEALVEALGVPGVRGMYEAFLSAVEPVYGGLADRRLYAAHTILQMIIASSLSEALGLGAAPAREKCSGEALPVDVVVPYLAWWHVHYDELPARARRAVDLLVEAISLRSSMVDWLSGASDQVFGGLYERLVGPGARRRAGEYYTPPWLAGFLVEQLRGMGVGLRGRVVLDPFSGSGSFLAAAFRAKIEEGEPPERAIWGVAGFDLNPIAVSVARAELLLAYARAGGGLGSGAPSPLVFQADSIGAHIDSGDRGGDSGWASGLVEGALAGWGGGESMASLLRGLGELEARLLSAVREARACMGRGGDPLGCVRGSVSARLRPEDFGGGAIRGILEAMMGGLLEEVVLGYLEGHRASPPLAVASAIAMELVKRLGVDVVVTNPPWIRLSDLKSPYGSRARREASRLLERLGVAPGRRARIVSGSDLSALALYYWGGLAREAAGFVMPRESTLDPGMPQRAGQLLAYSALASLGGRVSRARFIVLGSDAFGHGVPPTLVLLRMGPGGLAGEEVLVARPVGGGAWPVVSLEDHGRGPREILEPLVAYFSSDPQDLSGILGVESVRPKGAYVMGMFGGERRRGSPRYAGLVVAGERFRGGVAEFRLEGTTAYLRCPAERYLRYRYHLVYCYNVYPFYLREKLKFLFSPGGSGDLREYIGALLRSNRGIPGADRERLELLMRELRVSGAPLEAGRWYVVVRGKRSFPAVALRPADGRTVVESTCAYIDVGEGRGAEEKAYYYAGVVNYLFYKALESRVRLTRDQYARPFHLIARLGLAWGSVDEGVRLEVARASRRLHEAAPRVLEGIGPGTRAGSALEALASHGESGPIISRLVEALDSALEERGVDEEGLRKALASWVGGPAARPRQPGKG